MGEMRFTMKCENCGTKIRKWDTYCPKCGMELFSSESKPLKSKYLRGEYREEEEITSRPYDIEEEELSEATNVDAPYQNRDDYQNMNYDQYYDDEDHNSYPDGDKKQYNTGKDYNKKFKQKIDEIIKAL